MQAFTSQPQVGAAPQPQPLPQPLSQPLSQPRSPRLRTRPATLRSMLVLARSMRPNISNKGLRRGAQTLSQDAGPQAFTSQPQLGAAAAHGSQALTSQPQDGPFSRLNRPQPFLPLHGSFISQPQLGAAAAQGSQALTSQPQDGPFSLLNKPQPLFPLHGSLISQPQVGAAPQPLSQHALSHPLPFRPSMRSNNPPPKEGVHRLAPSIRDPIIMFHFIESQLPKR